MRAKDLILSAAVLGLAGGYAWNAMSPAGAEQLSPPATAAPQSTESIEHSAYYASCHDAWAAGHAPIFAGQPGYREELDGDGDGIACEPVRRG